MDDFDGDGRLDILITCHDPTQSMAFYRNAGDGTFVDRTKEAGIADQLGGLVCYQADYDNDGRLDVFIPRGAWHEWADAADAAAQRRRRAVRGRHAAGRAARPGQFQRRGLGRLRQRRPGRPVRRLREAAQPPVPQQGGRHLRGGRRQGRRQGRRPSGSPRGAPGSTTTTTASPTCSSTTSSTTPGCTTTSATAASSRSPRSMGIDGPGGFSCWSFDYDNDGWLDIFAVYYDRPIDEVDPRHAGHARWSGPATGCTATSRARASRT